MEEVFKAFFEKIPKMWYFNHIHIQSVNIYIHYIMYNVCSRSKT